MYVDGFAGSKSLSERTATRMGAMGLLLLITDAYRVGGLFGLSVVSSKIICALFIATFILLNVSQFLRVIKQKTISLFFFVLVVWPAVTATYSIGPNAYLRLAENALTYVVFASSVLLFLKMTDAEVARFFFVSLVVVAVGVGLWYLVPGAYIPLAQAAGAQLNYNERAFGFYLQPNTLGLSVCFLFFAAFFVFTKLVTQPIRFAIVVAIGVATVLASGSRFSMLLLAAFVLFRPDPIARVRGIARGLLVRLGVNATALLIVWVTASSVFVLFGLADKLQDGNVFDRVSTLLAGNVFHAGDSDDSGSFYLRRQAQSVYEELIVNRPIFGYGIGSQEYFFEKGVIELAAHSSFLAQLLEYGVLYSIFYFMFFTRLLLLRSLRQRAAVARRWYFVLYGGVIIAFVANHGVIENYTFYTVFAFFVVALQQRFGEKIHEFHDLGRKRRDLSAFQRGRLRA